MPNAFDAATGAPIDVPLEHLADDWRSGGVHLASGYAYHLQFQNGSFGHSSDPAAIARALDSGAKFVDPAVAQAQLEAQKYESQTGGALGAGAAGALSGLTLGLSDVAGRTLGGDAYAKARQYQQTEHPVASLGGEAAGAIGLTALTGGAAAAEELPAMAGVRAAEGAGVMARIGARAAAGVARGTAEGLQMGLQQAISDEAIADKPLTAAQILSTVGTNTLWGGALGGGFSGALGALGERSGTKLASELSRRAGGASEDLEATAARVLGTDPAPGLGDKLKKFLGRTISAASGTDRQAVESFLTGENAAANRRALLEAGEARAAASRTITKHVDDVLSSSRDITEEQQRPLKIGYIREAVKDVDPDIAVKSARDAVDTALSHIDEMLASPEDYGEEKALSHARIVASQASDALDVVSGMDGASAKTGPGTIKTNTVKMAPDVAEIYATVDNLKKSLGKYARGAAERAESPGGAIDDLTAVQTKQRAAKFASAYEGLRVSLEDSDVWGRAGENQKAINAAFTQQIDASSRFRRALTTEGDRASAFSSRRLDVADPAKADSYVKNLLSPSKDLVHQTVNEYLDKTRSLAETISEATTLPPEKLAQLSKLQTAVDGFKKTALETGKSLALVNQFEAIRKTVGGHGEALRVGLMGLGGAVGGLPGAAIGATLGKVGQVFSRPAETVMQLAQVERMARESDSRIARGLRGLLSGSHAPASRTPLSAFARKSETVAKLSSAPEVLEQRVTKNASAIGMHAPKLADAMAQTSIAALHFLASRLPPQLATDPLAPKTAPPPVSRAQQAQWLRYHDAVSDPLRVVDDLRAGRPSPEGVEVLRTVYPPLYARVQQHALEAIASGKTRGASPQRRLLLGTLLDLPLPELSPAYIQSRQSLYTAAPTEDGQETGAPAKRGAKVDITPATAVQSPADRVENGDLSHG